MICPFVLRRCPGANVSAGQYSEKRALRWQYSGHAVACATVSTQSCANFYSPQFTGNLSKKRNSQLKFAPNNIFPQLE
jgi:hypothetical protein